MHDFTRKRSAAMHLSRFEPLKMMRTTSEPHSANSLGAHGDDMVPYTYSYKQLVSKPFDPPVLSFCQVSYASEQHAAPGPGVGTSIDEEMGEACCSQNNAHHNHSNNLAVVEYIAAHEHKYQDAIKAAYTQKDTAKALTVSIYPPPMYIDLEAGESRPPKNTGTSHRHL
jgi:hypothetical protein